MSAATDSPVIKVTVEVHSYKSTVDQGIFVTFALSEDAIAELAMFAECKRQGIVLDLEARAHKNSPLWNGPKGAVVGQGD